MNESLKNFMTVTSKDQLRFLDAVVMRFVDRMDEVVGGRLKDFGRVLDQTNRAQQDAFASIRAGMADSEAAVRDLRSVQKISEAMVETMSGYLDDLRSGQRAAQEGMREMSGAVEQMDLVARQQTNYLKTLSAMQAEVARSVDAMTSAVDGFARRFAEENAAASQAMQRAAGELTKAGAHIESAQKSAAKSLDDELKTTLEAYREYVNQFTQRVDYLATNISDSLSRMPRAVGETSDQFLDQMDRLTRGAGAGAARAQRRRRPPLCELTARREGIHAQFSLEKRPSRRA